MSVDDRSYYTYIIIYYLLIIFLAFPVDLANDIIWATLNMSVMMMMMMMMTTTMMMLPMMMMRDLTGNNHLDVGVVCTKNVLKINSIDPGI